MALRVDQVQILVVDDVNAVQVRIRELLTAIGFKEITLASSGRQAIKLLSEKKYDLILSDWHMEDGDGVELLKYVRGSSSTKDTAFVFVTVENTKDRVIEAIKGGVDDYLVKPLTTAQIETKVASALVKRQII